MPKVVVASGSSLARSRLKLVPDAAAAAAPAAAAAIAAEARKLHTRREGGRNVGGRETGGRTSQPPHSGKPGFSSGGHSECAESQTVSLKPQPAPPPPQQAQPLPSGGGGEEGVLLSFPLAGKIPPLMPSACVKVLKWMSGDVFLSYFPLSQRMFPTPPSISGLRFSVLVRAWLPMV